MEGRLYNIVRRLRPDVENLPADAREVAVADVFGFVYTLPLALVGLVWLSRLTVPEVVLDEWPIFLGILALVYAFRKLDFQFFV